VLTGRGRFDMLNALRVGASTVALIGGALVIIAFANLVIYTAWMALAGLLETTLFVVASLRLVPELSLRPRISRAALARVRRFTMSMSLVRVLNIAIRESDRLALSVLAPIETLGYYALAYRVLGGLTIVQGFATTALFPAFAADYERGAMDKLVSDYNRATQGLIFVCTGPIALLMFFGYPILRVWTSADLAAAAAPILTILGPGFLLGMSVAVATTLATASGHTGIVIRRNVVGLAVYLPLLYVAITRWGGIGAAAMWVVINLSFLFTLLPLVQRLIIGQPMRGWLERYLLPYLVIGMVTFGGARVVLAVAGWESDTAMAAASALAAAVYGLWGLRFLDADLRQALLAVARRGKPRLRGAH
jgi:O-antigen/teichoic acid export membrane protein